MGLYRKKPVVVEAVRLTEKTTIKTLEGTMTAEPGDWLITGVGADSLRVAAAVSVVGFTYFLSPSARAM